jgi:hypothetical protein
MSARLSNARPAGGFQARSQGLLLVLLSGGPEHDHGILVSVFSSASSPIAAALVAVAFAPDLPPNSPEGRENPAAWTGLRSAVLGFLKRRGGDSSPRSRGTRYAAVRPRLLHRRPVRTVHVQVDDVL